jgi:hypothetical protein
MKHQFTGHTNDDDETVTQVAPIRDISFDFCFSGPGIRCEFRFQKLENPLYNSFVQVFKPDEMFRHIFPSFRGKSLMDSLVPENGTSIGLRVPRNGSLHQVSKNKELCLNFCSYRFGIGFSSDVTRILMMVRLSPTWHPLVTPLEFLFFEDSIRAPVPRNWEPGTIVICLKMKEKNV